MSFSSNNRYEWRKWMKNKWLDWAKRIQSLSQAGIAFSKDDYDIERFEELRKISIEIMAEYSDVKMEKVTQLFANETGYQTPKVDVRGVIFHHPSLSHHLVLQSTNPVRYDGYV